MLQTILSIAGKPGLYKLVSRGKMNLIVESLDETHKRQPAFGSDRVTSLADIAMFTESDDVPLGEVLAKVRVHSSDIKKLLQWYDILVKAGITNFEEDMKPTEGDNVDDRK